MYKNKRLKLYLVLCKESEFSLVGLNNAFNTTRLYKRPCQEGCVLTAVLLGNHKTKSAVTQEKK